MKITAKQLCQILAQAAPQGLSLKEMLFSLDARQSKKTELRKELRSLSRMGLCKKERNQYFFVPQAQNKTLEKWGLTGSARPPKAAPPKAVTSPKDRAIYLYQNRQHRLLVKDSQNLLNLTPAAAEGLMHGDEVRFASQGEAKVQIVEILHRRFQALPGWVEEDKGGEWIFHPHSGLFPYDFKVFKGRKDKLEQDKGTLYLEITRYPEPGREPAGKILGYYEEAELLAEEEERILTENLIKTVFPPEVQAEAEAFGSRVVFDAKEGRQDLRELPFVTIDGSDAKDFDDAIYAEAQGEGYRLWVAIADVADYVTRGSALDKEAYARGTSVYFPGTCVPMLPEELSNGLCSLQEGKNRRTLCAEIQLDAQGEPLDWKVYPAMIKNQARLTYEELDVFLKDGQAKWPASKAFVPERIGLYLKLSRILKAKRSQRGALDLALPEAKFHYDEQGQMIGVSKHYQTLSQSIVEEFMLEANEAVGRLAESRKLPILWRNHPQPQADKAFKTRQLFWNLNIPLQGLKTNQDFKEALAEVKARENMGFLEVEILRTLPQARYEHKRVGHFGLAAEHYCHFTSPIRRYPDLVVHRNLKLMLAGKNPVSVGEAMGEHCSDRERAAVRAERSMTKLKRMLLLKDKPGEIFHMKVSGLHYNGLFVEMEEPYLEGYLPFHSILDDRYDYDDANSLVKGTQEHRVVRIGTRLTCMLTLLDWRNLNPEFEWLWWDQALEAMPHLSKPQAPFRPQGKPAHRGQAKGKAAHPGHKGKPAPKGGRRKPKSR